MARVIDRHLTHWALGGRVRPPRCNRRAAVWGPVLERAPRPARQNYPLGESEPPARYAVGCHAGQAPAGCDISCPRCHPFGRIRWPTGVTVGAGLGFRSDGPTPAGRCRGTIRPTPPEPHPIGRLGRPAAAGRSSGRPRRLGSVHRTSRVRLRGCGRFAGPKPGRPWRRIRRWKEMVEPRVRLRVVVVDGAGLPQGFQSCKPRAAGRVEWGRVLSELRITRNGFGLAFDHVRCPYFRGMIWVVSNTSADH
jgi:hypothetical protein